MMGIWYEFLATPQLKGNNSYTCASWLMLQDKKNDTNFLVINNLMSKNNNGSRVRTFDMDCEATTHPTNTQVCYYQEEQPKNYWEHYTSHRERSFRIVYTDYFSVLIAKVCQSYGVFYYQDYVVLTREKSPSIYHKRLIK